LAEIAEVEADQESSVAGKVIDHGWQRDEQWQRSVQLHEIIIIHIQHPHPASASSIPASRWLVESDRGGHSWADQHPALVLLERTSSEHWLNLNPMSSVMLQRSSNPSSSILQHTTPLTSHYPSFTTTTTAITTTTKLCLYA
jgi:hypothetical protein